MHNFQILITPEEKEAVCDKLVASMLPCCQSKLSTLTNYKSSHFFRCLGECWCCHQDILVTNWFETMKCTSRTPQNSVFWLNSIFYNAFLYRRGSTKSRKSTQVTRLFWKVTYFDCKNSKRLSFQFMLCDFFFKLVWSKKREKDH